MTKIKEFRDKSIEEIKKLLVEKQEQVRKLRFDMATKQVKNTRESRTARRDVARMMTIINEK